MPESTINIDLSYNNLSSVPAGSFAAISRLVGVDLTSNNLEDGSIFENVKISFFIFDRNMCGTNQ